MMTKPDDLPVACTLEPDALEGREALWRTVMKTALRRGAATPTGVVLEFQPGPETDHALLDLVSAERGCCAWATWTLTASSDSTRVEVTAADAGVPVLHAMFEVVP